MVEPRDVRGHPRDVGWTLPGMAIAKVWGMVTSQQSGKILDIAGGPAATGAGAVLQQWQIIPDAPNQRFRFEQLSDGSYRIRARHSNKVLDVAGGSPDNGAGLIQWDWHGGANQRFDVADLGDGFVRITARHSGRVLDVTGFSRDNGARIIQWDWHGGANQRWRFGVPID
jgi:hypothetical protein